MKGFWSNCVAVMIICAAVTGTLASGLNAMGPFIDAQSSCEPVGDKPCRWSSSDAGCIGKCEPNGRDDVDCDCRRVPRNPWENPVSPCYCHATLIQ